ncbi:MULTISPECIES: DNA alkylation repair protein [unclassified Actinomyces]|uniref:DNA alkylation repair protein n=1 Tax=unclassified Actinomyces TaxID=2609248 RepID=UPI0020182A91|nr:MULTISPECIES: DNA alkylation repair protein [unclassified Actinomyces]MCL3778302.1 DNA alkylation repair protein [Actinomyces sp. AC-20-1]MCL3788764.1 DNA alkylation repair protein [Actinomyces sp. 187325]MCL3791632.1 DNA alkylation repair protein [Actinomyces sp. 186855]MCL3794295.1 DNA alkylation repair protein [Actinomyces sp. 217892]
MTAVTAADTCARDTGRRSTRAVTVLQGDLRAALAQAGDPQRAEQQRRYLKSKMPMYGVGVPQTRRLAVEVARRHPSLWVDAATWETTLRVLWDGAERREERFAVLAVIRARLGGGHAERARSLELYQHLVRSGAWWDLVDETSHAVGAVLLAHPDQADRMRRWARDEDLWVRRSAIICQLQHKDRTDRRLLTDVIEANEGDPEFFIRKAIGWALRDHARTDPAWVRAFVDTHPGLSPLSRREALKHL